MIKIEQLCIFLVFAYADCPEEHFGVVEKSMRLCIHRMFCVCGVEKKKGGPVCNSPLPPPLFCSALAHFWAEQARSPLSLFYPFFPPFSPLLARFFCIIVCRMLFCVRSFFGVRVRVRVRGGRDSILWNQWIFIIFLHSNDSFN